jgi:hypothetical protein
MIIQNNSSHKTVIQELYWLADTDLIENTMRIYENTLIFIYLVFDKKW